MNCAGGVRVWTTPHLNMVWLCGPHNHTKTYCGLDPYLFLDILIPRLSGYVFLPNCDTWYFWSPKFCSQIKVLSDGIHSLLGHRPHILK